MTHSRYVTPALRAAGWLVDNVCRESMALSPVTSVVAALALFGVDAALPLTWALCIVTAGPTALALALVGLHELVVRRI